MKEQTGLLIVNNGENVTINQQGDCLNACFERKENSVHNRKSEFGKVYKTVYTFRLRYLVKIMNVLKTYLFTRMTEKWGMSKSVHQVYTLA